MLQQAQARSHTPFPDCLGTSAERAATVPCASGPEVVRHTCLKPRCARVLRNHRAGLPLWVDALPPPPSKRLCGSWKRYAYTCLPAC